MNIPKNNYLILLLIFNVSVSFSQTTSQNFVITETILIDSVDNESKIDSLSYYEKQTSIEYIDGIGRPIQTILKNGSPLGNDIVQAIIYDQFGRQEKTYLPFVPGSNSGGYINDPVEDIIDFYDGTTTPTGIVQDDYPFSVSVFDNSPLNRIIEQGAPGEPWQPSENHTIKTGLYANDNNEVGLWEVNSSGNCERDGYYDSLMLSITKVTDENGNITKEYKDKQGNVILKKSYITSDSLETYYVYDDFGLLRFVIPPKAVEKIGSSTTISSSISDSLLFSYKYDARKRMTVKKLPGADSVYMIYDKRNRLVATQDGIRRNNNEWFFTKYDAFNRPILTGIWEDSQGGSRDSLQSIVDTYTGIDLYEKSGSTVHDYTNRTFPDESDEDNYLTVTYYDNYDFTEYDFFSDSDSFPDNTEESSYTKNLVTGTKIKVLTDNTWLTMVSYYDDYGRVIQTVSDNHFGGYDRLTNKYDFVGKVLKSKHLHYSDDTETDSLVIWKDYTYDHAGRLLKEYEEIDGDTGNGQILLTNNDYNELGELVGKNIHATNSQETSFLQEIDYSYNIRGWLKKINDPTNISSSGDLFGMELHYDNINDLTNLTAAEQYNGNISAIKWTGAHYDTESAYGFSYDKLNRITAADYGEKSGTSWTDDTKFNVYDLSYDKNGNIGSLNRDGSSNQIDSLYYQYKGNQLQFVDDDASGTASDGFDDGTNQNDDYSYDVNGNLTKDENKDIESIVYNELNLPEQIIFGDDTIFYVYDAAGVKLKKLVSENGTVTEEIDYIGELVYKNDTLDFILTSEGRIMDLGSNSYQYEYFLKDHLGNTRISFWDSSSVAAINQEFWYYPFGMTIKKFDSSSDNKYLYNGKEFQDDMGLDWYDYGARMLDPQLGRWFVIDKKAEKFYSWSPYSYVLNNALKFIDPDGQDVELIIGKPYTKNGEEHLYGHVALRVYGKGYNYVFDFGRYGNTWALNLKGDGILNVYEDGSRYLKNEQKFRESVGFNLSTSSEEDQKVIDYYMNLAKEGEVYKSGAVPGGGGTAYKLKSDYFAFTNNCTTISDDGLEQIGEDQIGNKIDPRALLKKIESNFKNLGFTKRTEYLKGGGTKVTYVKESEEENKEEEEEK